MPSIAGIEYTPAKVNTEEQPCDRLTAQLAIYHQQCGEAPTSVQTSFVGTCDKPCQPYERKLVVTEQEMDLDLGWVGVDAGMIVIQHRVKKATTIPTPEEREQAKQKALLLSFGGSCCEMLVRPGRFFCGELAPGAIPPKLRSSQGSINVTITIMPR